jgi:flavin-binding protein dodecin
MEGFEIIEKVGVSNTSYCDAVKNVVDSIQKEKKVYWFEVLEQRGRINEYNNLEFQVILRIGYTT